MGLINTSLRRTKIDIADFKEFNQKCSEELPNEIGKILQKAKGEKPVRLVLSLPMTFMVFIYHGTTILT